MHIITHACLRKCSRYLLYTTDLCKAHTCLPGVHVCTCYTIVYTLYHSVQVISQSAHCIIMLTLYYSVQVISQSAHCIIVFTLYYSVHVILEWTHYILPTFAKHTHVRDLQNRVHAKENYLLLKVNNFVEFVRWSIYDHVKKGQQPGHKDYLHNLVKKGFTKQPCQKG